MDRGAWCPWGHKELDTTEHLHCHMEKEKEIEREGREGGREGGGREGEERENGGRRED